MGKGERATGKQGKRITLAIFAAPPGPQKCLLGLLPKPATSGQNVQRCKLRHRRYRACSLSLPGAVIPSRWSMFVLTARASRISCWAAWYSA